MAVHYFLYVWPPNEHRGDIDDWPVMIFYEIVDLVILRVIEIYPDGHTGLARLGDMLELGGAGVPDQDMPEDFLQDKTSRLIATEITEEQFERYWRKAVDRIEHELGIVVTD